MKRFTKDEINWIENNLDKSIVEMSQYLNRSKSALHYVLKKYPEREDTAVERMRQYRIKGGKKKHENAEKIAIEFANNLFSSNRNNMFFMMGLSLYWAEGTKKSFSFTNGDSHMIRLFTNWIKEYFINYKTYIYIYAPKNYHTEAEIFWKNHINQEDYTHIKVMNASINTRLEYGLCSVRVSGAITASVVIKTLLDLLRQYSSELK